MSRQTTNAPHITARKVSVSIADFEQRTLRGFDACGMSLSGIISTGKPLMIAVSGGADSIALLTACTRLEPALRIVVVTIDHGIRPETESLGDARFVEAYCAALSQVDCRVVRLGDGAVVRCAAERGRGTEDAARHLRYVALEDAVRDCGAAAVCLAHTQTDRLETILLRFLQGSAGDITPVRVAPASTQYLRPLLGITRAAVEDYLAALGVSYRADSTNADTHYARNRVRHMLVPVLDAAFPGWQTALLSGAQKAADDHEAIAELADRCTWTEAMHGEELRMLSKVFYGQSRSVRRELLYRALSRAGATGRFPYQRIAEAIDGGGKRVLQVVSGGMVIEKNGGYLRVGRAPPCF